VAYECLTGEPPFTAETPVAIAVAHMHRPVPPLPDDVPAPVAELVTNMLAKPPEDRPQSAWWVADRARQLRSALPNTASGLPPEVEPGPAETAVDGGVMLAGAAAARGGETTGPRVGAAWTRNDMGVAAGATGPPRPPGRGGRGRDGNARGRRRSALLAAGVSVAVAAIGGTVAAVLLSSHPLNAANATPASSSAAPVHRANPRATTARPSVTRPDSSPSSNSAPTLRVGAGLGSAGTPTVKPTPTKTKSVKPTKSASPTPTPTSTPTPTPTPTPTATASTEPPGGNGHGKGPGQ
jgi:serine/threonine-protein kinase